MSSIVEPMATAASHVEAVVAQKRKRKKVGRNFPLPGIEKREGVPMLIYDNRPLTAILDRNLEALPDDAASLPLWFPHDSDA